MEEDLKAELTCPICMDLFEEPRRLPCGHVYCRTCLHDMLTRKYLHVRSGECILSCPECRQQYDLTFRHEGVDVFPRDFKLVRLVELYQRQVCTTSAAGSAGIDEDDQTAVKIPFTADTTHLPSASSSADRFATAHLPENQGPQQYVENGLPSLESPALSLSDDSWIYSAEGNHSRPEAAYISHERGDESWLLPSSPHPRFPVDLEHERRRSFHAPGGPAYASVMGVVSGTYENGVDEDSRRLPGEDGVTHTAHFCTVATISRRSPSSDDSESDYSDERGDDGEVSESESEDSTQCHNRRSRLTRFFRSLVVSDTDSDVDELEENHLNTTHPHYQAESLQQHQQHFSNGTAGVVAYQEHSMAFAAGNPAPNMSIRYFAPGGMRAIPGYPGSTGDEPQQMLQSIPDENAGHTGNGSSSQNDIFHPQAVNENYMAGHSSNIFSANPEEATLNHPDPMLVFNVVPQSLVAGGGDVAPTMSGRQGHVIEVDSDDSEDDCEPQTSMLRPRRKPSSRLKKFFTSLLSLSSSEDEESPVVPSVQMPE